jgi:N-acetylglucosamine-6-phosphate deacetylase
MRSEKVLVLTCAELYTPLEVIRPATIRIEDGRILSIREERAAQGEDLGESLVAPGFVNVHVHGYEGHDATSGEVEPLLSLARTLAHHGVTAFVPTTVTAPHETLLAAAKATAEAMAVQGDSPKGARILGLHLEGPYISPERRGAQNHEFIRLPDWEEFRAYWDASRGHIRAVTVAPELPGAVSFIEWAVALGVVVSLGHTNASYEEAKAAIAAGASRATHLYNAMPPWHHRAPGVVAACLESPQVVVELICDLVHVAPPMLRVAWRLAGSLRTALITDAIAAGGLPDGTYTLGGLVVEVKGGVPRLEDGALAGSTLTMDQAVRNAVDIGIPLRAALIMASLAPARACGEPTLGLLRPGCPADLVVLSREDLSVQRVYVGGRRLI